MPVTYARCVESLRVSVRKRMYEGEHTGISATRIRRGADCLYVECPRAFPKIINGLRRETYPPCRRRASESRSVRHARPAHSRFLRPSHRIGPREGRWFIDAIRDTRGSNAHDLMCGPRNHTPQYRLGRNIELRPHLHDHIDVERLGIDVVDWKGDVRHEKFRGSDVAKQFELPVVAVLIGYGSEPRPVANSRAPRRQRTSALCSVALSRTEGALAAAEGCTRWLNRWTQPLFRRRR